MPETVETGDAVGFTDPAATASEATDVPGSRRKKRRRTVVPLVLVAALAGTAAWGATRPWEGKGPGTEQSSVDHGTVAVEKGSLSSGIQVAGALSHDTPTSVVGTGQGTITALPAVGTVVKAGGKLYEVDGRPVVLMTGDRPMWRELGPGVGHGPDVKQLKSNLVKLGHAGGLGLAVDEKFTDATATAVKRWQKALGVKETGTVTPGSVVMLAPAEVQVQKHGAQLGSTLGAGSVMTVSGTDLVAVVQPAENQLSQFKPNGKVLVNLSGGGTVEGRVRSLLRGDTGGGDGGAGGSGGGGGQQKTSVTIALDSQDEARSAGPSAVTVNVVGQTADDALIVPVTALLALDGGGYGVKVVDGATSRLVKVRLGLVADAKAQITGDVRSGDQVVIPK
ncbi:peptidoglycan-binding protein [Streptomyces sp. NPDC057939]|uniref:peptidoglycan-binding protein n=1 Tax=Streptomyces sp. NPDC057939 TaxID=3346284 RepID=UPI0036ED7BA0